MTFETKQSSCLTSRPSGSILALEGPFPNEWKKARPFGEKFWIYVVTPPVEGFKRVRLVVSGIPASKIADVNRGILMPISRAVGDFQFTLEIDVSGAEGISQATLESQVKETIRQIGASIRDEVLE